MLVVAFSAGGAPPLRAEDAAVSSGVQITEMAGEALVRFEGRDEWVALETDTPLQTGDRVRVAAGGRVEMITADGDVLELQENSELEIRETEPKQSAFQLFLGGLLAKIRPDTEKKFRVRTPLAAISVRGTEFAVDVENEKYTELGVTEGNVAIQELAADGSLAGEEISVQAQQGAGVLRGRGARHFRGLPPAVKRRLARMAVLRARAPRLRERWRQLPPERRQELRRRTRERWQSLAPQDKQRLRRRMIRRWRDKSPDERQPFKRRLKDRRR